MVCPHGQRGKGGARANIFQTKGGRSGASANILRTSGEVDFFSRFFMDGPFSLPRRISKSVVGENCFEQHR